MKALMLPDDMIEFLEDHPIGLAFIKGNIRTMMKNAATTGDDPKQAAKLCSKCNGFDGAHNKYCALGKQ